MTDIYNTSGKLPDDFFSKLTHSTKEYIMEQSLAANREELRKEIIEKGRTELSDDDSTMFKFPRSSCIHCYGTGRKGWDSATGQILICNCMRRGKLMDTSPEEFISVGEFLKIFKTAKPGYPRDHIRPKSLRRQESKLRKSERKRRNTNA